MKYGEDFIKAMAENLRKRQAERRPVINIPVRGYNAANTDRLTFDWKTSSLSADGELRGKLRTLRARSRDFFMNNTHGRKFVKMCVNNVVGPKGVGFQSKIRQPDGSPDSYANKVIEAGWRDFCKRGNCTVDGQMSMTGALRLTMHAVPNDGEVLIRKVRNYDNPHNFAIQLIEADHLDEDYNQTLPNGNTIVMGVEKDVWGRPLAYHLLTKHPGDYYSYTPGVQRRVRIPADEIIHLFIPERIRQSRGVPWAVTTIADAKMLGGYKEAAVVNARVGASTMGFYEREIGAPVLNEDKEENTDEPIREVEPGIFEKLPPGYKVSTFNTKYPDGEFAVFYKAMLRSIAAGLDVSYNSLAADLEGVNYSSIRQGVLDERSVWEGVQLWLIESMLEPIFEEWLAIQLVTQNIPLPFSKFYKFNAPNFIPRGWPWVDPLKDENANAVAIKNGTTSRTRICAAKGVDFEEVLDELYEEEQLAKKKGIVLDAEKASLLAGEAIKNADDTQDH